MTSLAPAIPDLPKPVPAIAAVVAVDLMFSPGSDYSDLNGYTAVIDPAVVDLGTLLPPIGPNTAYVRVIDGDTGRYLKADAGIAAFNEGFYLSANPDVAAAVAAGGFASGREHYDTYGWREGRDPSALFDAGAYLSANPDVATAGIDPARHFSLFGLAEGRDAWRVHSVQEGAVFYPDPNGDQGFAWLL